MKRRDIREIELRLKAPMVALERVAEGRHLPRVFAKAGLKELCRIQEIVEQVKNDQDT